MARSLVITLQATLAVNSIISQHNKIISKAWCYAFICIVWASISVSIGKYC